MPAVDTFRERFHVPPASLVRAPGRVNLIGEHTDYNQGYVLPMAIDRSVQIALRQRKDRRVVLYSDEYKEEISFNLENLQKGTGWQEFVKGSAWAMQVEGRKTTGWEGVISGDIPRGAGLSSSSAVTVASILAFCAADGTGMPDRMQTALLAHRVEDEWIGVHGGVMDQMVCLLARQGHALFLDCRSLTYEHIPLPAGISVAILDTSTRRGLVNSAYNQRRAECDAAAMALNVSTLREVNKEGLRSAAGRMDEVLFRRARHVVSENRRVQEAVNAMRDGDARKLGSLLDESHASLRDDFEVSSPVLDDIVRAAKRQPGCLGARLSGAGFAGCAVALVESDHCLAFPDAVAEEFKHSAGLTATIHICSAADGASVDCLTL